ncbi:hypothetical protein GPROT1_00328 [Gammaproteobacteria bacterium]|nr:hypothetical protein GPROT1_00328 [Gammaproteobacteria bacterium]
MPAYSSTSVPVERSKEAIRKLLIQYGARGVQFTEEFATPQRPGRINVRFAKDVDGQLRTVSVALEVPRPPEPKRKQPARRSYCGRSISTKTATNRDEQMYRATYRALHWWLKSQFEAVEFGLLSFEDVFLAHFEWIVDGRSTTVGALIRPRLMSGGSLLPAPRPEDDIIDGD